MCVRRRPAESAVCLGPSPEPKVCLSCQAAVSNVMSQARRGGSLQQQPRAAFNNIVHFFTGDVTGPPLYNNHMTFGGHLLRHFLFRVCLSWGAMRAMPPPPMRSCRLMQTNDFMTPFDGLSLVQFHCVNYVTLKLVIKAASRAPLPASIPATAS